MTEDKVTEQTDNKPLQNRPGQPGNTIGNRWQPGESGNPGGRPKDPGITKGQIEMLDEICPYDTKGRTWRAFLIDKGLLQASASPKALEDLKDRLEGKVPDTHKIESDIPINIVFKETERKE